MSWFGYDQVRRVLRDDNLASSLLTMFQGVFSGVLISADFKKYFPETSKANISGITSSCFSVSVAFERVQCEAC